MSGRFLQVKSPFFWPIIWLLGMAAIATWSIVQHLPAIQQQILNNAQTALTSANAGNIELSIDGRTVTLTGPVANKVQKQQLLTVVAEAEGVRGVVDKLDITRTADSGTSDSLLIAATSNTTVNEADEQPRFLEEPVEDTGSEQETAELEKKVKTAKLALLNNAEASEATPSATASVETTDAPAEATAAQLPALNLKVADGTMTLTGQISSKDSLFELIRTAMDALNANYVVNNIEVDNSVSAAGWLPAVTSFLPDLSPIKNASIDIVESQVLLAGVAATVKEHDNVIDEALSKLSDLSLVERISITPADAKDEADKDDTEAEKSESSETETSTQKTSANSGDALATETAENNADAKDTTNNASDTTSSTAKPNDLNDLDAQRAELTAALDSIDTSKLLFQSSSDELTTDSLKIMETLVSLFKQYPTVNIEVSGHTDTSGSSAANLKLSQLRAKTVQDYLIKQGIAEERVSAYGLGDAVPIADNSTPAGRRINRRIEFNF